MPELPDVVVYLEALERRILQQPLEGIRLISPFVLRSVEPPVADVVGRRVTGLQRLGKRLVWALEGERFVVIHLMIAGRLRWTAPGGRPPGRIGLAAFGHNPGIPAITGIGRAQQIVRDLKRQSDIVIVSFHGGAEGGAVLRVPKQTEIFLNENRGDVYRFSHAVVDAGANIVFGHGPHVPRAIDVYKGAFIAYSLGNFWTYGRFNLRGPNGIAPVHTPMV